MPMTAAAPLTPASNSPSTAGRPSVTTEASASAKPAATARRTRVTPPACRIRARDGRPARRHSPRGARGREPAEWRAGAHVGADDRRAVAGVRAGGADRGENPAHRRVAERGDGPGGAPERAAERGPEARVRLGGRAVDEDHAV